MRTEVLIFKRFFNFLLFLGLIATVQISCEAQAKGNRHLVNINGDGVILDGYDPISFFNPGGPQKGNSEINYLWHEATYYFSNQENKNLFIANPEKYAPQFGAYCGYAVSLGHLAPIDVRFFSIVDGRLILQHNQKALNGWNDNPRSLGLADKYWPQILEKKGKPVVPEEENHFLVNLNQEGYIAEGYDVVAYFTENKAVKGDPTIVKLYNGAFFAFSSEENKQLFGANPGKFLPQYGGYCAYAVSRNKLRPIDPKYFQFVDGRLMLQHSQEALDLYSKDIKGNTIKGDQYWPELVNKNLGKRGVGEYDNKAN